MKGGLSMYLFRNTWLEQINIADKLGYKPGMDLRIHWLDPLLHKCEKRLCPGYMGEWQAKLATSPDKVF